MRRFIIGSIFFCICYTCTFSEVTKLESVCRQAYEITTKAANDDSKIKLYCENLDLFFSDYPDFKQVIPETLKDFGMIGEMSFMGMLVGLSNAYRACILNKTFDDVNKPQGDE